jgi:hypothetical protein
MFEMLLASDVGSLSWKRSAVLAIALHGAAVAVVTGGTDAPYERPLPRDTIRVDLRLAQAFRPRPWLQEPHQSPELPTPPAVVIPAMRFDRPVPSWICGWRLWLPPARPAPIGSPLQALWASLPVESYAWWTPSFPSRMSTALRSLLARFDPGIRRCFRGAG